MYCLVDLRKMKKNIIKTENTLASNEEKFILITRKLSLGFLIGATVIVTLFYFTLSAELAIFGLAL